MKKHILLISAIAATLFCHSIFAQDTLPNFTLKNAGNNRIIVSWTNNYKMVKQISIQRSNDSLTNYKTILTVPDPKNIENGYVDAKSPNDHMFYRLFIMLDGSMFIFSHSKKPVVDTNRIVQLKKVDPFSVVVNRPMKKMHSVINISDITDKNKPNVFVPSLFVFTANDGNLHLNLPLSESKKYSVKFYDENDNFLFELKNLKEPRLTLDKTNFYHAGWFKFELFENEKLKEKSKFYIEKEF